MESADAPNRPSIEVDYIYSNDSSAHVFTPEDELAAQQNQILLNRSSLSVNNKSPHQNSSIQNLKNIQNTQNSQNPQNTKNQQSSQNTCTANTLFARMFPSKNISKKSLLNQQKSCNSFVSNFSYNSGASSKEKSETPKAVASRNVSIYSNKSGRNFTDEILNELNNRNNLTLLNKSQISINPQMEVKNSTSPSKKKKRKSSISNPSSIKNPMQIGSASQQTTAGGGGPMASYRRNSVQRRSSIVSSNKELRQDFRRQSVQGTGGF